MTLILVCVSVRVCLLSGREELLGEEEGKKGREEVAQLNVVTSRTDLSAGHALMRKTVMCHMQL